MAPLGKSDLLGWAEETGGIRPCSKYADLRDGVVFLALVDRLFPGNIDPRALRRGPLNVEHNWDTLRRVMERFGLPVHLCDRNAISAGHTRHCFNMLVLFYFLVKLSHDSDFCVDFANPIDAKIAEFLQSPQSLCCVGKVPSGSHIPTEGDRGSFSNEKKPTKIQTMFKSNATTKKIKVKTEDDARSMSSVSYIPEDGDTFTSEDKTRSIPENNGRSVAEERARSIAEDRARSIAEDRARSFGEYRERSITEDRSRGIGEYRERSIAEDRARSFGEYRERSIAEDRSRGIGEYRERSMAEERARSIAEDRDRSIAEDRARSFGEYRERSIAEERARSVAEDRSRGIGEYRERSVAEDRARSIAEDRARSFGEYRERSIAEDRARSVAEDRERSVAEDRLLPARSADRPRVADCRAADLSACSDRDGHRRLRASHAQLLAELDHVRAASRLALSQQRALVAAEMSRMTEQCEARLAVLRLERDHELRCQLIDARAELDALAAHSPAARADAAQRRAAESELREARETAESLRSALEAQCARHDAFARRVEKLCAADGPSEWDELDAPALRSAAVLRVRALSAECRALRDENARLRANDGGLATPLDDAWEANNDECGSTDESRDIHAASSLPLCACGAGQRLSRVTALFAARGAAARRALSFYRAQQRELHAQLRAAESARAADAQRAQRNAEAQRDALAQHAEDVTAAAAAKVHAAEEQCARREANADALHKRANEMLSAVLAHARQAPALAELRAPLEALRSALHAREESGEREKFEERDAEREAALREARGALRRREAALKEAEAAQKAAEEKTVRAEAEAAALRDAMTAEAREIRGLIREITQTNPQAPEKSPQPSPPMAPPAQDTQDSALCGHSLLSHEELERRKLEILGKYGFIATSQNKASELL